MQVYPDTLFKLIDEFQTTSKTFIWYFSWASKTAVQILTVNKHWPMKKPVIYLDFFFSQMGKIDSHRRGQFFSALLFSLHGFLW